MRDSLRKLVAARFVERVPSPEPVLGNKEGPAQKKRGAKVQFILRPTYVVPVHECKPHDTLFD